MDEDVPEQILHAVRSYLETHFPGAPIEHERDGATGSTILHIYDGRVHRRLELTETYLDADGGADLAITQLSTWNVADALRNANDCLVRLATTGVHTEPSSLP